MYKPLLALALSGLLFNQAAAAHAYAPPQTEKEARRAEKVKARIAALGTGESARVRIALRNRRGEVKGNVREAGAEGFTLVDPKSGVVTVIPYAQVKAINPSHALSIVAPLAAVGTIVIILAVAITSLGKS
ncbi:MAG TPA: hypothetical protein VJ866_00305 [Pyrinomonadaceae bacterium]|nr:hypothetical protein [Pyrinomonadaceae bacterium]